MTEPTPWEQALKDALQRRSDREAEAFAAESTEPFLSVEELEEEKAKVMARLRQLEESPNEDDPPDLTLEDAGDTSELWRVHLPNASEVRAFIEQLARAVVSELSPTEIPDFAGYAERFWISHEVDDASPVQRLLGRLGRLIPTADIAFRTSRGPEVNTSKLALTLGLELVAALQTSNPAQRPDEVDQQQGRAVVCVISPEQRVSLVEKLRESEAALSDMLVANRGPHEQRSVSQLLVEKLKA